MQTLVRSAIRYQSDGRRTPEYMAWIDMRKRCTNPNFKKYARYGGRGIKVCSRWMESFENFLEDMGPRPDKQYTLERENNDGDYTPSNCVWATYGDQNKNYSFNHLITIDGRTQHLAGWCREIGITIPTFYSRCRRGYGEVASILLGGPRKTPKVQLSQRAITYIKRDRGRRTQAETAKRFGLSVTTVRRIQIGEW